MALRTLILGAAGRDFHNFNVLYRERPANGHQVVAFTAAQIPDIAGQAAIPRPWRDRHYSDGIPIVD